MFPTCGRTLQRVVNIIAFVCVCVCVCVCAVADLFSKGGSATGVQSAAENFWAATPTSGHAKVQTEYLFLGCHAHFWSRKSPNWIPRMLEATLDLVKRLEISKELIRECVTVPGCCCCMLLLHNHLMDLCSYVHKNTLLAAKWGALAPPLPPPP